MDSGEGQIYDLQAGYQSLEVNVDDSDLDSFATLEKMRRKGLLHSSAGLSQLFWVSEEDETESVPRDTKYRWKKMMQKRIINAGSEDAGDDKQVDMVQSKWQDMPMELLVRILALVDDRTVVVATGVCTGWRDSICAGVTELSFAWCKRNVSNLVQSVARKFSRLENCSVRRCSFLNDDGIGAVGVYWHNLRALDLTSCTRLTNIMLIAIGCPSLEKLDLSGCVGISEAGLVGLAQHCKHLQYLNLCGCDNACSDDVLLALAQNCSGLQYVNVGWCEHITDAGVTELAVGCRDLRFVDFCGCRHLTDQSVSVLAENCLRLRVLGFHCCRNITDVAMYSLVNSNKRREMLRSNKCNSSTDSNMRVRELGCEYSSSTNRSNNSFAYISARSCSSSSDSNENTSSCKSWVGFDTSYLRDPAGFGLLSLNLSGCTALSAQAVQAVCDAFPQLHTCPERHSLITSGCLNLTTVRCVCVIEARRERLSRAVSRVAVQPFHPRHRPL